MSKTLENLSITEEQLELLKEFEQYGHTYFDIAKGNWIVDFRGRDQKCVPAFEFSNYIKSKSPDSELEALEVYIDDMFIYTIFTYGGQYGFGYAHLMTLNKNKGENTNV